VPVLQKYEILSFTLREEHRLRVFEIGELRKTFWSKRDEVGRDCVRRSCMICIPRQLLFERSDEGG
jgi:hypothetical protein